MHSDHSLTGWDLLGVVWAKSATVQCVVASRTFTVPFKLAGKCLAKGTN